MDVRTETSCDRDDHKLYEYYVDFNEWLDSDEAAEVREANNVDGISVPSKAFYAGDKEAYDQAFKEYREKRRNEVLNERYLCEQFTDNHWFDRNIQWNHRGRCCARCVATIKVFDSRRRAHWGKT